MVFNTSGEKVNMSLHPAGFALAALASSSSTTIPRTGYTKDDHLSNLTPV